jgi:hypothetical protein
MNFKRCALILLAIVAAVPSALHAQPNVVHYTTTNDNVKYLFATAEPVARLKSGDILDTNTLDCFGNALKKPGDTLSMSKGDNPLAGPFFIEGAEPGDTLAVKILDLQVDGDTGVGAWIRRHQRDKLHAYAASAAAGAGLVLSHRSRCKYGPVQGARF